MSLVFVFDVVLLDLWNLSFNFENNLKKMKKETRKGMACFWNEKEARRRMLCVFFFFLNTTKHFYTMPIFTIHFFYQTDPFM